MAWESKAFEASPSCGFFKWLGDSAIPEDLNGRSPERVEPSWDRTACVSGSRIKVPRLWWFGTSPCSLVRSFAFALPCGSALVDADS